MKLELLNLSAYNYMKNNSEKFNQICEPLFKLGIKYFSYFRFFNDGSYLTLNNLPEDYQKAYLFQIRDHGSTFTDKMNVAIADKNNYSFLSSDINQFDKRKDPIMHLLYDFDIWNAFLIHRMSNPNFVEAYNFCMTRNDIYTIEFYLNNLSLLEHFINYFNERAKDLMDCNDKRNLAYFEQQWDFNNPSQEQIISQKLKQFFQDTQISRNFINNEASFKTRITTLQKRSISHPGNFQSELKTLTPTFSRRQYECGILLLQGLTAKQMARRLNISHRTIEEYINILKQKLHVLNRTELIIKLNENFKNNCFII